MIFNALELFDYGWAPGNHALACTECNEPHYFATENSYRCRSCAEIAKLTNGQRVPKAMKTLPQTKKIPISFEESTRNHQLIHELIQRYENGNIDTSIFIRCVSALGSNESTTELAVRESKVCENCECEGCGDPGDECQCDDCKCRK